MKTAKPGSGHEPGALDGGEALRPQCHPTLKPPKRSIELTQAKQTPTSPASAQPGTPIWSQVEQLAMELGTLQALLFNASGDASASFNSLEDAQREAYLAHCADLVSAAKAKAQQITDAAIEASRSTAVATA